LCMCVCVCGVVCVAVAGVVVCMLYTPFVGEFF